jgi:hypothetical protein
MRGFFLFAGESGAKLQPSATSLVMEWEYNIKELIGQKTVCYQSCKLQSVILPFFFIEKYVGIKFI